MSWESRVDNRRMTAGRIVNPSYKQRSRLIHLGHLFVSRFSGDYSEFSARLRYSSRSRRVASRSNMRYFISRRSWLNAS